MPNVYIEARPEGRASHIDDYVAEDHADHVLGAFKTQREAIDWAKKQEHARSSRASPAPERQEQGQSLADSVKAYCRAARAH